MMSLLLRWLVCAAVASVASPLLACQGGPNPAYGSIAGQAQAYFTGRGRPGLVRAQENLTSYLNQKYGAGGWRGGSMIIALHSYPAEKEAPDVYQIGTMAINRDPGQLRIELLVQSEELDSDAVGSLRQLAEFRTTVVAVRGRLPVSHFTARFDPPPGADVVHAWAVAHRDGQPPVASAPLSFYRNTCGGWGAHRSTGLD